MTDQAAYRRYTAEAERLMEAAGEYSAHDGEKVALVQRATVWAALALAAAQERVQPADRPTDQPARVKDGEGDVWFYDPFTDLYAVGEDTKGSATLAEIASRHGGYTEVT